MSNSSNPSASDDALNLRGSAAAKKPKSSSVETSPQRRSAIAVIVLTNLLLSFGFQMWRSLFNNFAVEELGVRADQMGLIQAIREVPGLLSFSIGLLALLLTEMRIAGLSVVLMSVGIIATGATGSLTGLVINTLVMSVGFHFFMPSNSSAILMLVGEDEAPNLLGRLSSLSAFAAVASASVVFLTLNNLGFRPLFYATGALVLLGGLGLLSWSRQITQLAHRHSKGENEKRRILSPQRWFAAGSQRPTSIRKRYWLYYLLEFLMGSRRHIFTTFAIFLLVDKYQVTTQTITILFVINNLAGTLLFNQFGKIINRFGERRILSFNFIILIIVFLGYAYVPWLPVLYGLFVADHILFGFRISLQSYFQKIAVSPDEITPNLSLGQTINHVAAIFIPVVGGVVWEALGSQYTFLIGVSIVVVSLIFVQGMHVRQRTAPDPAIRP